jgi:hypothetical protein
VQAVAVRQFKFKLTRTYAIVSALHTHPSCFACRHCTAGGGGGGGDTRRVRHGCAAASFCPGERHAEIHDPILLIARRRAGSLAAPLSSDSLSSEPPPVLRAAALGGDKVAWRRIGASTMAAEAAGGEAAGASGNPTAERVTSARHVGQLVARRSQGVTQAAW